MEKMRIDTLRTSRKTAECAPVVLKQTQTTRLVFLLTIVDNDSNPSACVHGILCHCIEVLKTAISRYGTPEILNSDQGCQFTSKEWADACAEYPEMKASMDDRGQD